MARSSIWVALYVTLIIFSFTNPATCEILFQDNFDGYQTGWTPSRSTAASYYFPGGSLSGYEPSSAPEGQRNNQNSWNGWIRYGNNTINIVPGAGRNGTGALRVGYDNVSPMHQVGLIKWLGYPGHQELYIKWYFRFDDRWCWGNGTNGSMVYFKTMRVWQGVDLNNLNGKSPTRVLDFPHSITLNWQDDNWDKFSPFVLSKFINDTKTDVANCPGDNLGPPCNEQTWWTKPEGQISNWLGPLSSNGCFTQPQTWHSIQHRIRLRDTIEIPNAVYEVWIDGVKLPAPSAPFNQNPYISMDGGGMNWIVLADNGTGGQYWSGMRYLYIDNFVVSTSFIEDGNGSSGAQPPERLRLIDSAL